MGIKRIHNHEDGRVCYEITAPSLRHPWHTSKLSEPQLIEMKGETFAIARWSFTGKWRAYDLETGKKIDDFSNEFYERFIKPFKLEGLVLAPDCDPSQALAPKTA